MAELPDPPEAGLSCLIPPKRVLIGPQALEGELVLPPHAQALIAFAHGSGSSRLSPRNLQVAHALNELQLGRCCSICCGPRRPSTGTTYSISIFSDGA